MRSRPDDAGPREDEGPTECPICGAENYDEARDVMLEPAHSTCGAATCIAEMEKIAENDRAADEAQYEAWCRGEW